MFVWNGFMIGFLVGFVVAFIAFVIFATYAPPPAPKNIKEELLDEDKI